MTLTPAQLESWTARLLEASGVPGLQAADAAEIYRRASMRGLGHHDLSYLPQRLGWLADGAVNARADLARVRSAGGTEVWEGDGGLGEVCCYHALRRALVLATNQGVGYAGIRNSNHFLAGEPYTQVGASQGYFTLVWSNTDAGMAFPGQHSRQIGNNPMGWGLGTGHASLSADLCMANSSLGNLNALVAAGALAPAHWGRGPDGEPTTDPRQLLAGAVEPVGGHKGLALALLGEVLTGILTGGPTLDEIAPGGGLRTHNQMVLAFDLEVFGGIADVEERLVSLKARAHHAGHTLRLPGDRSREAEHRARREGIPVPPALEATLRDWSERLAVSVPE